MLIRLSYASQYQPTEQNLLEDLRTILVTARAVNTAEGICGVLYYAHGHFFQCLEGEAHNVMRVYAKIQRDSRHTILKCFEIEHIDQAQFSQWSMKYAKSNSMLQNFLNKHNIHSFKPQNLAQHDLAEFIRLLLKVNSLSIKTPIGNHRGYQHYF